MIGVMPAGCRINQASAIAERLAADGAAVAAEDRPLSDLAPSPAFEAYCEASGGYGERVSERAQLAGAVERGLEAVRNGQQALINMICAD